MNTVPLNSEYPPELIAQAVVLPHGHFVELDDMFFQQHGLGPRYAQILTNTDGQQRSLSHAFWNLKDTNYDLITQLDSPRDLGSFEELNAPSQLVHQLKEIFQQRCGHCPTPQQLALALIKAKEEGLQASNELGAHRLVKWALQYERRAHWIVTHREQAFVQVSIDWQALGL